MSDGQELFAGIPVITDPDLLPGTVIVRSGSHQVVVEPVCDCCAHITRAGDTAPRRVPAIYWWTCQPSGNVVPLCVSCCAYWRQHAADDPSLAPSRIRLITASA